MDPPSKPGNGDTIVAFADPIKDPIKAFRDLDTQKPTETASPSAPSKAPSRRIPENASIFYKIAYNPYFENTTMGVICCNAIWIGVDTEWNHSALADENGDTPLMPVSTIIENIFCFYFSGELLMRYLAFDQPKDCLFDAWFVFDSVLVACMILETWIMAVVEILIGQSSEIGPFAALRLLRLLRLARVGRLMKFVPEMAKLVKGMVKAARSVVFILIFLVLVIYVFAIIFTSSLSDRDDFPLTPYCSQEVEAGLNESEDCLGDGEFGELGQDMFATMGDSFMSLLTRGVLGDNLAETVQAILDESLILMWLFIIFLIITFATLLNMLIGVVCEVIAQAAAEEEENATVNSLSESISNAFYEIDTNQDGLVSQKEWSEIKDNKLVRKSMIKIGIDEERMEERLSQMQEMLFHDLSDFNPDEATGTVPPDSKPSSPTEPDAGRRPSKGSGGSDAKGGLTLPQLIQKVVEIRPDCNASALDLELLKAQVMRDQSNYRAKLRKIELGINKVFNPDAVASTTTGKKKKGKKDKFPGMPALPDALAGMFSSGEEEKELDFKTLASLDGITLSDCPTSLLFECLKKRDCPIK